MLDFMRELAMAAGRICLQEAQWMSEEIVEYKSARDLVTKVDRKVEDYLRTEIGRKFPDHGIIGEERGTSLTDSDSCWVIDPIDGTTSYVHGLPGYTVSIALQRSGETVAGVVYAPVLNQMFAGDRGNGASMNGKKIRVSKRSRLSMAVLTTGFACSRQDAEDRNLESFMKIVKQVRDIRRHGSAALDLAWVAAGKLDGYWEPNLNLYDVAAGTLLVTEAGGQVCDFSGGGAFPYEGLIATNGLLTEDLLRLISG